MSAKGRPFGATGRPEREYRSAHRAGGPADLPIVQVEMLGVRYVCGRTRVPALDNLSLTVHAGEIVGVAGESGAGKSTLAWALVHLLPRPGRIVQGRVLFHGRNLATLPRAELTALRGGRIGLVPSEPMALLEARTRVRAQLTEAVQAHRPIGKADAAEHARGVLMRFGVAFPDEVLGAYPTALPALMRLRVAIGVAMVNDPALVIADDITRGIDPVAALELMRELRSAATSQSMAILWLTSTPAPLPGFADRVAVMYAGTIVEEGAAGDVLQRPAHPYTRSLLDSDPVRFAHGARLRPSPATGPRPPVAAVGCAFRERCASAIHACLADPPMQVIATDAARAVRCHRPLSVVGI